MVSMAIFLKKKPESLYEKVLNNLATAAMLLDKDLKIGYLNPASEMLFEMGRRKALGTPFQNLVSAPDSLINNMRLSFNTERQFSQHEVSIELGKKKTITVDCMMNPLMESNNISELLVEFVQIDGHLKLAQESRLVEQQNTSNALLRGLSHEIKNPLGGLRGAAQLLEKQLSNKDLKEYTKVIIGEADRLKNLVNRMLSPSIPLKKKLFNIHEVVERVRALVKAQNKHINIHRDYDPSIPEIVADPEQLIQVLLNLACNSAEALDGQGDIVLRTRAMRQFTISKTRHKLVVAIEIIDNGPGVPEDIKDKIFFPMITGRVEGTGLGLSIAQSIVNHHGGLIDCISEPGHTVFQIFLPLEECGAE